MHVRGMGCGRGFWRQLLGVGTENCSGDFVVELFTGRKAVCQGSMITRSIGHGNPWDVASDTD